MEPQSAIGAALDQIDSCTNAEQVLKTAQRLVDIFHDNDTVLEFLKERCSEKLESFESRKPMMTLELFRKIMGGTQADA